MRNPPPVKRDTVADVAATWLARHVEKKAMRTADEMRRVLDRYVLPHWRDRVFAEIVTELGVQESGAVR